MIAALIFHQTVQTPNGPGIVQGLVRKEGEPPRVIVSHSREVAFRAGLISGEIGGIWHLQHYAVEDLTA